MTQTLTIRNVPDALARKLKARAERNHRSLQGEVMAILVQASSAGTAEQPVAPYQVSPVEGAVTPAAPGETRAPAKGAAAKKLAIHEIWERGKRLGLPGRNESARIVRKLRDERYGR